MNFDGFAIKTLELLHKAYADAYSKERNLSDREKKIALINGEYLGVDEFPDWNEHVRRLEAELVKNGVTYTPIELE